jgi:hypothetical protein
MLVNPMTLLQLTYTLSVQLSKKTQKLATKDRCMRFADGPWV